MSYQKQREIDLKKIDFNIKILREIRFKLTAK